MIDSHDSRVALAKIAYVGPEGSGKTATLTKLLERIPQELHGELTRIDSIGDRLLSVDVVPANLAPIAGRALQLQLTALSGRVDNEATLQRLLEDADGVVFVADCRVGQMAENVRMLGMLEDAMGELGMSFDDIPLVIQHNHRDARRQYTVEEIDAKINLFGAPTFQTVATTGKGLFSALKTMTDGVVARVTSLLEPVPPVQNATPRRTTEDDTVQFAAPEEEGGTRSSFTFPATHRTVDGQGASAPFGEKDENPEDSEKGGMWRRLATRFKK